MKKLKQVVQDVFQKFGYVVVRDNVVTADMDPEFVPVREAAQPYSMTSVSNMFALYKAVAYIVRNDIPGSMAECGVWRGGSTMAMALTLMSLKATPRDLFLFDTFEGMTPAGPEDILVRSGESATALTEKAAGTRDEWWIIAHAALEEVCVNMRSTGYPSDHVHYIQGDVLKTLAETETGPLALIRLDTDWYESTRCELEVLYPRLVSGGVLIIDDYGSWQGARKAVDEFISDNRLRLLLTRVDSSMRIAIKP